MSEVELEVVLVYPMRNQTAGQLAEVLNALGYETELSTLHEVEGA